jgi:hypothetical protein
MAKGGSGMAKPLHGLAWIRWRHLEIQFCPYILYYREVVLFFSLLCSNSVDCAFLAMFPCPSRSYLKSKSVCDGPNDSRDTMDRIRRDSSQMVDSFR